MKPSENNTLNGHVLDFGDFELDSARRELRHAGKPVELQPRVFDLLEYLVRHHDRVVDKDELQDAIWSGMVVTEASLTRAVMKARKAIGDDANQQALIRTVHGRGYHFVGKVKTVSEAESRPLTPELTDSAILARPWIPTTLIILVIAVLAVLWHSLSPVQRESAPRVAVTPVQDTSGNPERAWIRLGLMSLVTAKLAGGGEIAVVEDSAVAGLAGNVGWDGQADSAGGQSLRERLHRAYGASHVLFLELETEGARLRLNYALIDAHGGSARGTMVTQDPADLADGVVQAVYGHLLRRSRMASDVDLVSADPFNNEAYARGMDLALEGRCADAVPFFRLIAEQEPGLFAPRLELAACLRVLGQVGEAESLLLGLVESQRESSQPGALGKALLVLGVLYNRSGRLDAAEEAYREALATAQAAADADLAARVLHNLSILAEDRGQWDAAFDYLDRAAASYQQAGRDFMPGHLWSGYANLNMDLGRLDQADDYLQQALAAFREVGDRRNEAMMLNNTGYLRRLQGRLDDAVTYHQRSLAIREDIRDRVGVGRIHGQLAQVHLARGDVPAARDAARQALDIAREAQDRLFEATALATLADAEKKLGEREAARSHLVESRAVLDAIQDSMRALQVDLLLARMDLEEGRPGDAESVARSALEAARAQGHVQPELEALELLADVAQATGQPERALALLEEALRRVREAGMSGKEVTILAELANQLMDLDRLEAATPLVGALVRLEPNPAGMKARARHAWASGDAASATRYMTEARDMAGPAWSAEDQARLEQYSNDH